MSQKILKIERYNRSAKRREQSLKKKDENNNTETVETETVETETETVEDIAAQALLDLSTATEKFIDAGNQRRKSKIYVT